jgi:YrbI family 3-deoxy-D-manno-octulosonate 8-phosphate phosphatase
MKEPKLLILDVDGVLTDGTKFYGADGRPIYKRFNDKDFTAIKLLKARGVKVCFLTADPGNIKIAQDRRIDYFISRNETNRINKAEKLPDIKAFYGLQENDPIWVIGDDLFDVELFKLCALSFCPSDAPYYVRNNADGVSDYNGGDAIVLDLVERFLDDITDEEVKLIVELDSHEGWSRHTR